MSYPVVITYTVPCTTYTAPCVYHAHVMGICNAITILFSWWYTVSRYLLLSIELCVVLQVYKRVTLERYVPINLWIAGVSGFKRLVHVAV